MTYTVTDSSPTHPRKQKHMNAQMPTIALVHGAFAESASWNPVIERLRHHGVVLVASHDQTFCDIVAIANPLRSVASDAAYVRDVIRSIGGPVILVGHSYGGMVITEAASDDESVVALVYVGAFAPDHGESAFQLSTMFPGSTLGDALNAYPVSTGGNEFAIKQDLFHHQFAADVRAEEAALMAATQRPVTQAALSAGLPTDTPAWKHIPSWFVYGDQDLNIPTALQHFMAERAGSRGTRVVAGASHAIGVSHPDAVSATILEAVTAMSLKSIATPLTVK
jgi:pimeloyl-ACP methyl ester carboxylesterase